MAKKFQELRNKLLADPEQRILVTWEKHAIDDVVELAKLREERTHPGGASTKGRDTPQPAILRIGHEEDVYLSALRHSIAAMGGRLEINAVFPDGVVQLCPTTEPDLSHWEQEDGEPDESATESAEPAADPAR